MNTDSYSHHTQHKGYRPKFKNKKQTTKKTSESNRHQVKKGNNEILNELRKTINRNADYCEKELEIIKKNQEKSENSFAGTKTELKAMNSRMNNAEERYLEDSDVS